MKIKLLLLALIVSAMAFSQNSGTVNLIFKPIQSIEVNSTQKNVDLIYDTKDDYQNGVNLLQSDHLKVFSTGGFKIEVNADGDFKNSASETINSSDMTLLATAGSNNKPNNFTTELINLSHSNQTLVTSNGGGKDIYFNIEYSLKNDKGKNNNYVNKYKSTGTDTDKATYTAQVMYTIIPN